MSKEKLSLKEFFENFFNKNDIEKVVFGGKRKKSQECRKIMIRPVLIRDSLIYQAEFTFEKKVTHENISPAEAAARCVQIIENEFKQVNAFTTRNEFQILASKPENPRITSKPRTGSSCCECKSLSHNKQKNYIIPVGKPCDFLAELKVMSPEGKVYQKYYSKFRQINRFLEIVDDSFDSLDRAPEDNRPVKIIDFGCGKSYLTFALYYYFVVIRKMNVEIIGLDLKEDVIAFCNATAEKLGYDSLKFLVGDIADYIDDHADMVVTLHACDTATDYALINAVGWNTKVILSVPCCQHEMFSQIKNEISDPMLKHGIIKDKFTELLTDGLRGLRLEACGYSVSMIEFTSLEHTSKNIMIKAVRPKNISEKKKEKALRQYEALKNEFNVKPTIDQLPVD